MADPAPPPLLRTRRGLMFTALPAIAVLAVLAAVLAIEHRNASADDRRVEIRGAAMSAAADARRYLDDQHAILQAVAVSPDVAAGRASRMRPYLLGVAKGGRFTSSVAFIDANGLVRASTRPQAPGPPTNVSDRDYVTKALAGKPAISDALVGRVQRKPVVVFSYPTTAPDGRRTGVVVGSLALEQLDSSLKNLLAASTAKETIIDGNNKVVAGVQQVNNGLVNPPSRYPIARMRRTGTGVINNVEGHIVAFAPVPGTGWYVIVDRRRSAIIGPLDQALFAEIGALALLALVGVFLTFATGRRLDRLDRERDQALAEQREIALQLQNSLLPDLRVPAGIEAYAGYVPAQGTMSVGGDWYDLVDMGNGCVALSVGDVAGHGLGAAATMGKLRSGARAQALHGLAPIDALTGLDTFASLLDGRPLATVMYGVLDPDTGVLRYALAGHPPPLLIRADGSTHYLEGGRSPLLGVTPVHPREDAEVTLAPGDTLVVYTDGLVERPEASIDDGLAALARRARVLSENPPSMAGALLASVTEPRRDDAAVLIVRLAQPSSVAS